MARAKDSSTRGTDVPPPEFEEFVERHLYDLLQVTSQLTGNPALAERMRIDLLSRVAGRWRYLSRQASSDDELRAATDAFLATQIAKEESAVTDAPPDYRQPPVTDYGYSFGAAVGRRAPSTVDVAEKAWQRSRRSRRNRWLAAVAGIAALGLIALLVQPATKPVDKPSVIEVPAGVTVLPSGDGLLALPTAPSLLPASVTMDLAQVIFNLSQHHIDRAIAMFQLPTDDIIVLGADGELNRWDMGGTEPVAGEAGGIVPAMASTSLSPDGTHAVLRGEGAITLADLTSGRAETVPAYPHTTGIAWHDNTHVWLSNGTNTGELDITTKEVTDSAVNALTVAIDPAPSTDRYILDTTGSLTTIAGAGSPTTTSIGAPTWLGGWLEPAYRRDSRIVATADATALPLPSELGDATRAAVLIKDGRYVASLVGTDAASGSSTSSLTVLGWLDDQQVLVSTQASTTPVLLAWDVNTYRLTVLTRLSAAASTSVASQFGAG
jgi:hypothetical protein